MSNLTVEVKIRVSVNLYNFYFKLDGVVLNSIFISYDFMNVLCALLLTCTNSCVPQPIVWTVSHYTEVKVWTTNQSDTAIRRVELLAATIHSNTVSSFVSSRFHSLFGSLASSPRDMNLHSRSKVWDILLKRYKSVLAKAILDLIRTLLLIRKAMSYN